MITYQDFEKVKDTDNKLKWIAGAISQYRNSDEYRIAVDADEYEAQRNVTINKNVKLIYDITGVSAPDPTASNNRIASNFFHRLNTDRCSYSLGNGISFPVVEGGIDTIKKKLGKKFDTYANEAAYFALIHGKSFMFVNGDEYPVFPMTQFLPLWDENDGTLRAGIRFWSLDWNKRPVTAVLYEEDGYTKYRTAKGKSGLGRLEEIEPKRTYKETVAFSEADGEEVIDGSNYSELPIVPWYACKAKQSTLVGMRANIDAYDMIHSGFANDLQDCAQIYWLIGNAMGMEDKDVQKLRERLIFQHMAVVDTDNSTVTPYTQEIPYNARMTALQQIRNSIYENFGGLDVHTIAAGATNDHIDAAYQTVDEEADQFEYMLIQSIQQVLRIKGIEEAVPQFQRGRISNLKEQTEMVAMLADKLDWETILKKVGWITVDEIKGIIEKKTIEDGGSIETEE